MAFGDLKGTLTGSVNSVTNPTVASGSVSVVVGDLVFCTMSQQTNLTAGTVTDNLGNTYTALNAGTDAGNVTIRSYFSRVTVAGTLTAVNFAATASTNDASVVADVIEGPFLSSPLDANPANTTDGTSPHDCPATGTLAQADECIMSACAIATNTTLNATSPGSITGTVARNNASVGQQRRVVSSTSSVTPQFGNGATVNAGQTTASFKKDPTQTLTPSLFSEGDTFFTPTITTGPVDVAPSLFSDGESFFTPTVSNLNTVTPSLYEDADTFFTPTVTPGAVDLAPSLFSDDETFYTHDIATSGGSQTLAPDLYVDDDTFHSATVTATYGITPDLYEDADTFYTQVVSQGAQDIAPDLFTDGETFHTPTVTVGAVNLDPSLFTDADTFHSPTVTTSNTVAPDLYTDADTFFTPAVSSVVTLTPSLYIDGDIFFTPTVAGGESSAAGPDYFTTFRRRRR